MNELELQEYLLDLFDNLQERREDDTVYLYEDYPVEGARSFEDGMLLTLNKGIQLFMNDGAVFDLTIVRRA